MIFCEINSMSKNPLRADQIEGALNRIEFDYRELFQKDHGIDFMTHCLSHWMAGHDLVKSMKFEDNFRKIRENVEADSMYFNKLVERFLVNNKHYSIVTLEPDPNKEENSC
eukprot:GHVP01011739.1.p1 GENE.GHVP01011739.1~~GHVP01011739.1.p1  ORF type:complete len:111 (+),score=18.82 GHVP01011739.1:283-615(+)